MSRSVSCFLRCKPSFNSRPHEQTCDPALPDRHHHNRHAAPGQLCGCVPARRPGQPPPRHREFLLPGRLPRVDQVRPAGAGAALDTGDRGLLAGRRARPGAGAVLSPVRHSRDPGADLAADLRHRQGPAQPRPCLQGGCGQEQCGRCRRRRGDQRRVVHVSGADGSRHPDVQGAQDPGRARPGAARRDGARHRQQLQLSLRRPAGAARSAGRRERCAVAGTRRAQDEQELRQCDPAVRNPRPVAQAHRRDRHRFARAR